MSSPLPLSELKTTEWKTIYHNIVSLHGMYHDATFKVDEGGTRTERNVTLRFASGGGLATDETCCAILVRYMQSNGCRIISHVSRTATVLQDDLIRLFAEAKYAICYAVGAVVLEQRLDNNLFRVRYATELRDGLTYNQAAREFGRCVMHMLECEGKLNGDGP